MIEVLRPILQLLVVIPGAMLAIAPVKGSLKYPIKPFVVTLMSLLLFLCILGGLLSYVLNITTTVPLLCVLTIVMTLYCCSFNVSLWKTVSIALSIVAIFASLNSFSRAFNAIFVEPIVGIEPEIWFSLEAGLIYNACCWLCLLLAYYPGATVARRMIEDRHFAQTWYVFWILPTVIIALNIFMVPTYPTTLYTGRVLQGYFLISILLLIFLLVFYSLFLMMANYLNRNAKLQYENHMLSWQQEKYDNLCEAIEEAKLARHDMRHHFNQLYTMAENDDIEGIKVYLSTAIGRMPILEQSFCKNRAVDSVLSHYCALARQEEIPIHISVDLPTASLSVDEMDLCLILANLLENAFEASLMSEPKLRWIDVALWNHLNRFILLQIENFSSVDVEENNGKFLSTKRKGNGRGIQSVRRLAEKNGGVSDFSYQNGVFTAKIMLRCNHIEKGKS